jgi:dUTP pyrophosphatase
MSTFVNNAPAQLLKTYDKFMYLKLFVADLNELNELKERYRLAIDKHNEKILNSKFVDAGFDLFLPENEKSKKDVYGDMIRFVGSSSSDESSLNKINFRVKCSAQMYCDSGKVFNTGFYMYSRSSLSKTPLRLANKVGIVDSGYRGDLLGLFDMKNSNVYFARAYDRLLQICAPGLLPIYVELVESEDKLGPTTERGSGGIGSTGI